MLYSNDEHIWDKMEPILRYCMILYIRKMELIYFEQNVFNTLFF